VGNGLLVPPQGLSAIVSPDDGLVQSVDVDEGERVTVGQQVATLAPFSGGTQPIFSGFSGEVIGGWESVGAAVEAGQPIAQVIAAQSDTGGSQSNQTSPPIITQVIVFVPVSSAKAISTGTPADVEIRDFPAAQFGAIKASTKQVYRLPLAERELNAYYGGAGGLVSSIDISNQALRPVLIELETDTNTPSGYAWTFGNGPTSPLPLASQLSATFDIDTRDLVQTPGLLTHPTLRVPLP